MSILKHLCGITPSVPRHFSTGSLFYLAHIINHIVSLSVYAMRQGSHVLVHCIAVNIRFLCTIIKKSTGNGFLWLTGMHHV
jgi:hypothetical protein